MIDITKLTDADKGREVRYTARDTVELGRITSWNRSFIFVRYHTKTTSRGTVQRTGETSEATSPEDLEFVQ